MKIRGWAVVLTAAGLVACGGAGADETGGNEVAEAALDSASAAPSETVALTVPSMSCPLCVRSIEARLEEAGLRDIRVDLETKRVTAVFDPSRTTVEEVAALVESQGFPVTESRVEGPQPELQQ